VAKT
jgi:hypothetical protein